MNDKDLNLTGGDGSTNQQAITIHNYHNNYGPTEAQIRQIQAEIFRDNMTVLAGQAAELVMARGSEFAERLINEKLLPNPDLMVAFAEPSMQIAAYEAQKYYAKYGDNNTADLLLDLLASRAQHPKRSLLQIVIDESLAVIPRLTEGHIDLLSVMVLIRYYNDSLKIVNTHDQLQQYLHEVYCPFATSLIVDMSWYRHLVFCSCLIEGTHGQALSSVFINANSHLFTMGIPEAELEKSVGPLEPHKWFLIPCPHNPGHIQTIATSFNDVRRLLMERGEDELYTGKFQNIYFNTISWQNGPALHAQDRTAENILFQLGSFMKQINEVYSMVAGCGLTSVGVAIGQANIKRKINLDVEVKFMSRKG